MTIDLAQIKDNSMVRYGFKILLMREFDIHINETDVSRLIKAAGCIEIYDSLEEFLEKSSWKKIIQSCAKRSIYWIIIFAGISRGKSGIFQASVRESNVGNTKLEYLIKLLIFIINHANIKKHNLVFTF